MSEQTTGGGANTKRSVEPTLHFITSLIKIGDDYTTDKITVSEPVQAGQLLADFPNFQRMAAKGFTKELLEASENAHLSIDGESVVATVHGYPKVFRIRRKEHPDPITLISVEPLIKVSPDNMKASLAIHPPLTEGRLLRNENLETIIADHGITFGLDLDSLKEAKQFLQSGEIEFRNCIIARGQEASASTDAFLRYELEIGPIAGKVLDNGAIDFRERRVMVGISAGQVIATKIPAVQGNPGINIYGEETPAPPGKDIKIETLNDAKFSAETLQVTATKNGVLSIVRDSIIKVCSHEIIKGDIDYEIGNIESMNCITIRGSVQPGFKVTAGGDIEITGGVTSAKIVCHGNLVVKQGVTGKNSSLEVQGDADLNFIEQGNLQCSGLVVIRKQAYLSEITTKSDIRCHQSSKIIGGSLVTEGNITLGDVGSETSIPPFIAAGTIAERFEHFKKIKASVLEQQEAIIKWIQEFPGSANSKKIKTMEKELADTKLLLLRINMIPGTGIYSRAGDLDESISNNSEDYSNAGSIPIEKIKIDVLGTIHAGTKVQIGNCQMTLDKTVSSRQFKLHPNKKMILVSALKR